MKIKAISVIVCATMAAMFLSTSCSKDEQGIADHSVRFVAGLLPQTMAPIESDDNGLVTSGTVNGIQILQGAYGSTPKFNEVGAVTRVASLDNTGILSYSPTIDINTDGSAANFLAFYPLGDLKWNASATTATVTYAIDGETDIIAANRVSKTFSISDNTVNLAFNHQLARLRLRCVCVDDANGALYQGITEAKILVPKTAVMTIPDNGIITTATDPALDLGLASSYTELNFGTCEMSQTGEYATKDLLVLPGGADRQIIRDMEIRLKFAGFPDDAAKAYSLNNLSLVAGKTTTITVTVSGATHLVITSSIEAWNSEDTGNSWVTE